jgi:hypothetical protein
MPEATPGIQGSISCWPNPHFWAHSARKMQRGIVDYKFN